MMGSDQWVRHLAQGGVNCRDDSVPFRFFGLLGDNELGREPRNSRLKGSNRWSLSSVRYCNGFPNLVSKTEVLHHSIQSIQSRSFLSIPALAGHKSGHILFRARSPIKNVGFPCTM